VKRNFTNFDSSTASPKNAYLIGFHFAVLFAAKHGDNWKVRVVATYRDSDGVDSNVELIGTDTFSVRYFGAFTTLNTNPPENFPTEDLRDDLTIDYGDVIKGASSTVENISTGSYVTNSSSDVSLSADAFGDLAFSGNATPASGEVSLGCEPQSSSDSLSFFANHASGESSSISLLNSVQANSSPGVGEDARDPLTAEDHKCTFYAGDSATTGTYTNTVTVGIGES
jgi:spore coat protein U-like protein